MKRMFAVGVAAIAGLGVALSGTSASAQEFGSPELIAAAINSGEPYSWALAVAPHASAATPASADLVKLRLSIANPP